VKNDFHKITSLSDQMLAMARSSEWEQLSEIEGRRNVLMKSFFSEPIADSLKNSVAHGIRHILEKDREITRLSALRKKELRSSLNKMGKNRSAVRAYAAAS